MDVVSALPHDEIGPSFQLAKKVGDLVEVIGEVGVRHHDVLAASGLEAGVVRVTVAAPRLADDDRAGGAGELPASVRRAVVDDDHLSGDAMAIKGAARCCHALGDGLGLVQARDDDGDAHVLEGWRDVEFRHVLSHRSLAHAGRHDSPKGR